MARGKVEMYRRRRRRYTGVMQYFHNYEHDPLGRTHCTGPASNPYRIAHINGLHKVSHRFAVGHGIGCKRQWFEFPRKLGDGYNMASGQRVKALPTKQQRLQT